MYDESKSVGETVRECMDKMNLHFWVQGSNDSQVILMQIARVNQVPVRGKANRYFMGEGAFRGR